MSACSRVKGPLPSGRSTLAILISRSVSAAELDILVALANALASFDASPGALATLADLGAFSLPAGNDQRITKKTEFLQLNQQFSKFLASNVC